MENNTFHVHVLRDFVFIVRNNHFRDCPKLRSKFPVTFSINCVSLCSFYDAIVGHFGFFLRSYLRFHSFGFHCDPANRLIFFNELESFTVSNCYSRMTSEVFK